jgi:hypothetical protein
MRKTRASQASSSEKLLRLKQELATAAELVASVLKREQLKREASQQAKAVWEKREDLASLKRKFPSLLNAKEDEELFYDKEKIRRPNPVEPTYVHHYCLRALVLINPYSRIVGLRLKSRDNKGDLVSSSAHHDAVVRPKDRAATIIAQVDREMARIKDRDHHWEDGIEVCPLTCNVLLILTSSVECLSAPADRPSSAALQMDPPIRIITVSVSNAVVISNYPRRSPVLSGMACRSSAPRPWRCTPCGPPHLSTVRAS